MWDNFVFLVIFDTCDVRIQLYWECTNSTLPSIVLESICIYTVDLLTSNKSSFMQGCSLDHIGGVNKVQNKF